MIALPLTDKSTLDCSQIAQELIGSTEVSERFRLHLVEFLKEAYGLAKSQLVPDIKCFVNAQANTYSYQGQGEINNICGAIQLAPGRTGKKDGKRVTVEKTPDCVNVNFAQSELLYDSCAFTDVLTGDRISPEAALKRQLNTLAGLPSVPPNVWLVSYDRLIDEKHVMGERIKERWSVEQGESAVIQTVGAAQYLNSQRQELDGHKLVMSCQGVDADQYQRCVEQVLEVCQPDDVLGLGGWCILGKQKRWLPVFWEVCDRVIPIIAQSGIKQVHIFGCTWYKPMQGFPVSPLTRLLEACDEHGGLSLSVDGRSPIGNALWKTWKQAGATFPYWRHNLAWVKAELATLRDSIQLTSTTSTEIKESKLEISFGYTKDEILAGLKECTRRDWKDSHAAKFIKAYEQGLKVRAIDKDRRAGGKQIGWVTLTQKPYQQHIGAMTEADLKAEGGMCSTVDEFCDRYFSGDLEKVVWVIWFKFEPLAETLTSPTSCRGFTVGNYIIEDGNNPGWGDKYQLQILIKRGEILSFKAFPGCEQDKLHPFIRYEDGREGFGIWEQLRIDEGEALKEISTRRDESKEALEEVMKAIRGEPVIKEPIAEWTENSRAFYKGQPCQIIQLGTGSYKNKAKITTPDFEEKWVHLNQLSQPSSSTNSLEESADSVKAQESLEGSPSETTLILTPQPLLSTDTITPVLPSTEISEPTIPRQELMSRSLVFPVPAHQERVLALDSITPNPVFGLKPCDASSRGVQTMFALRTLKVLSTEDYGKFLGDSEWLDIRGTIRSSYQQLGSAIPTSGTECSLLPTPTTYPKGSGNYRPAGQTKLELSLRPHFLKGEKLNPQAMGWMMGFRPGYVEDVLMPISSAIQLPFTLEFLTTPQNDEQPATSTAEASCPNKLRSHFVESSTSTQSLENEVMVQSVERITPSLETQNLEEQVFGLLPDDGDGWMAVAELARELQQPEDVIHKALNNLGKADRIWSQDNKWCRKPTHLQLPQASPPEQKLDAIGRYLERAREKTESSPDSYPKEEWLNPDSIILDCGTQSRPFEFSQEKLDDYKEDMKSGDWDMERRPLPEVCLAPDGRYYAVDCHHRVQAAIETLHPGRLMLFLVSKGSLSQARLWSAAANTKHGLGADNSPQGVRKRITMFLDNIEELSPEQYEAEFFKVPDLTPKEKEYRKFSSRTIARYLRLRPGQDRTVSNIMKERELTAKISQWQIGDRIEVFFPPEIEADKRPKGFIEGEAGTIHSKDKKVGLWVRWDKLAPNAAPFPINPDFVVKTSKPKPESRPLPKASNSTRTQTPTSVTGTAPAGGSVTFSGVASRARVLPDTERNEDATAQENVLLPPR